jgi:hypothetical protein
MLFSVFRSPLLGNSFGSFAAFFAEMYGIQKVAPHNDFLYLFLESRLIGLSFYVWYIWKLTRVSWSSIHGVSITASVSQAAVLSLVVIDVLLFFQNPIFATEIQDYIFTLLGISSAYVHMRREQAKAHSPVRDPQNLGPRLGGRREQTVGHPLPTWHPRNTATKTNR